MRYLGGKSRESKWIVPVLESLRRGRVFVDLTCGSCSVVEKMVGVRVANDLHPDLILMWKALVRGWEPPEVVEDDYQRLRHGKPSPLRGFAGFLCSYSGKFFGGWARDGQGTNYADIGRRAVLASAARMQNVLFMNVCMFRFLFTTSCLVYIDPPYAKTQRYKGTGKFAYERFWPFVRRLSLQHTVVVSSFEAPEDFEILMERTDHQGCGNSDGLARQVNERLFRVGA